MADEIHAQQILIVFFEKGLQAANLAGCTGEQDRLSPVKTRLDLRKALAQPTLRIFCTAQRVELRQVPGGSMNHSKVFVIGGAIHDSALCENRLGELGKNAARGAAHTHRLIERIRRIRKRQLLAFGRRIQHRASPLAGAAMDTGRGIDRGIGKTVRVRFH